MTMKKQTMVIVCIPNTKKPWRVCHSELGYGYYVASKNGYETYDDAQVAVERITKFNEEMKQLSEKKSVAVEEKEEKQEGG